MNNYFEYKGYQGTVAQKPAPIIDEASDIAV